MKKVKMEKLNTETAATEYNKAEIILHDMEDASIALRVFGQGPAIVFIHGYPVSGYTWHKLLPTLATKFTCYVIDLPGLGDSRWQENTDFTFTAQAERLKKLFDKLNLNDFTIIAHDTGATIARLVALLRPEKVNKLVMFNTEIPGHRPPWVQLYQVLASVPLAHVMFRMCMNSSLFIRSPMGLGQFYSNPELFQTHGYIGHYIDPLVSNTHRLKGALSYLKGIEWKVVDGLRERHKDIPAEVLFLWGEEDKTFPAHLAEEMCKQFKNKPRFIRLASASLMPHEEQPEAILEQLLPFLLSNSQSTEAIEVAETM